MLNTEPCLQMDKEYVRAHLSTEDCIALMEETLRQEYAGAFTQPLRHVTVLPAGGILGFMPAYSDEGYFGAKVLSVFPGNSREGFPSHQGVILLFEGRNGRLLASIDATEVTRIRTGAVSAVASRLLARPDSAVLALLGTGEQAVSHLEAMQRVFPLREVWVWNRSLEKAEAFCRDHAALAPGACLIPTDRVWAACHNADIVCTLTQSKTPLFARKDLKPGAHICAVGSCTKDARELDSDTVRDARFFCDKAESVFAEAGDFVIPLNEGVIDKSHLLGSLGALLAGEVQGRRSPGDITVFESLGLAVEDLACAIHLYKQAARPRLSIRHSTEQDFDRMMEIYSYARDFMAEHGNPYQWGPTHWPPEELIHNDIREGNSYVCVNRDGKVVGTFFFTQGEDIEPTYRDITDGAWPDASPYGVIHRLAGDGSEKGIGAFCINWAYDRCGHLRIDTHGDNVVMQNLAKKLGFTHCGTIYVEEDDYPRLAYEKSAVTLQGGK